MSLIENITNYVGSSIYRAGRLNTPFYCNIREGYCWWELRSIPGDFLGMWVTTLAISRLVMSWDDPQLISFPTSPAAKLFYTMAGIAGAGSSFITWSWLTSKIPFSDSGAYWIEKNTCSLTGLDVAAVGFIAMGIFSEIIAKKTASIPVVMPPVVPVLVFFADGPQGPRS